MTRTQPISYRGFSIEQETDGFFSVYRFEYICGNLKTVADAKVDIDRRVGLKPHFPLNLKKGHSA